ncbi:hypothetical protein DID88_002631 [Monilinia fructigena]|uniref:Uncharacterized protein n=1 Tax=Monilinia fructigena TaxID=38457 RepID=A0A395IPD8_9HELO|nr:hypothetical protein DID88_002631 [Monilinia fructigena]
MGKLVGLISSGIGLAIEAKMSHQSPDNKSSAKDGSLGKSFTGPSQVSHRASPSVHHPSSDEEAYQDLQASPHLDAVNVAAAGVGFAPGITPMMVSMVVPIAVRAAKGYQTQRQSSSFLDRANLELFVPHGLFAMVLTFNPDQMRDPYSAPGEVQLPVSAPLIYPEDHRRAQQTGLKKVSHFIADYGDRRAQARFAHKNPDSSLVGPVPTFESRWGDPNHLANSGGLKSLLTGIPDDRNSHKEDRYDRKRDRKSRRRRGRSSSGSSRRGGLLSTALGAVGEASERRGISSGGRPSLVGMTRGMVNGPGKQNQSLIKGVKGIGMKTGILYLMITDNTENPKIPPTRSQTPSIYTPPPPSPFYNQQTNPASDTGLKSSNLDQQEIYLSSYRDPTPSDTDQQQNNDTCLGRQDQLASGPSTGYSDWNDVPPPPYREAMPTRYYDRMRKDDEEFCVPTL